MNILVIGGTRFFGIHMVNELLTAGYDVTIATRGKASDSFGDKVKRIFLERTKEESVREALSGTHYDVVIDKIAYCSNDIKYVMDVIDCDKYIYMSDATVAPKDVLEAAKGKDVDIVLDMNGYKWTINGNNIQADNLKDINLSVDTDSDAIPDDVISELAGNNPVKQISLAYSGDFGFKASLTYNIGSEYAGKYGNLYYYDSTGRMIFQNAGAIDADGNISLNFSHASEYAVVIADYAVTTDNADNTATGGIATGDSSPIVLYAVLCVMAIALAGIAAVTRKKNV